MIESKSSGSEYALALACVLEEARAYLCARVKVACEDLADVEAVDEAVNRLISYCLAVDAAYKARVACCEG